MHPLIVGIDLGTTALKLAVFTTTRITVLSCISASGIGTGSVYLGDGRLLFL